MKKLNNGGWSTGTFIGFIIAFIVTIIVISILAYNIDKNDNIPLIQKEYIIKC